MLFTDLCIMIPFNNKTTILTTTEQCINNFNQKTCSTKYHHETFVAKLVSYIYFQNYFLTL